MGVLVLMFELSRGYWTLLVDSGLAHGENYQARNFFRDLPCAVNNQLRTGADKRNPTV